tara:strand:- start:98 stop:658 length:561 start_codon:yes stop_codon:yes gene_type:complete
MKINHKISDFISNENSLKKIYYKVLSEEILNNYTTPSNFLSVCWDRYKKFNIKRNVNNNEPGKVFEEIFGILLILEGYEIFSKDKEIDGVPLVKPDIMLKSNSDQFIFISLKTSLRERWKQADWESIRFKHVYPDTKCYLITLNETEKKSLKKKIDNNLLVGGLDDVFFGLSEELNSFFELIRHIK